MIDIKTAQALSGLVNNPKHYKALKEYAEFKIRHHHKELERQDLDLPALRVSQGAIHELQQLLTLYDAVKGKMEDVRRDD